MAKQDKNTTPVQGAGDSENLVEHVITQEDLDNNPELVEQGVQVGETVKVPAKEATTDEPVELPEWVQSILDSNAAVIKSNESVVEVFEELKALANLSQSGNDGLETQKKAKPVKELKVNLKATYVVAEGMSFRDKVDFTKEYTSGQEVTGLDEDRLKNLLEQGLIQEA